MIQFSKWFQKWTENALSIYLGTWIIDYALITQSANVFN